MKRTTIILGAAVLAAGLVLGGCGGGEQPQPQTETQAAQPEAAAQTAEAYPIDWCIVSGQKLGSMGEPVTYAHAGRTVKLCCQGCVGIFAADPDAYLAKLDSAAAGLIKAPGAEPADKGNAEGEG